MRFQNIVSYSARTKDGLRAPIAVEMALADVNDKLMPKSPLIIYVCQKDDWQFDIISGPYAASKLMTIPDNSVLVEIIFPKNRNTAMTLNWNEKTHSIQINGYWIPRATVATLAAGIMHEWCHALGFHHQDKGIVGYIKRNYWSEKKSLYSLPYHLSDNYEKFKRVAPRSETMTSLHA